LSSGTCIEYYKNDSPGGEGPTLCVINNGTWFAGMACSTDGLFGYCEQQRARLGQVFYYYWASVDTIGRSTIKNACPDNWHDGTPEH
jgi:hypothetical protein